MRIGFLSDLHITHNASFMDEAVDVVYSACKANSVSFLFLAGDTTNNYRTTIYFVEKLNSKGIKTFFVLGNHEYWSITYENSLLIDSPYYIHGKTVEVGNNTSIVGINGFFDYSFVTDIDNEVNRGLKSDIKSLTNAGLQYFDLKKLKSKNYLEIFEGMKASLETQLRNNSDKKVLVVMHHVPHEDFISYSDFDSAWNSNNAFMGSKHYHELFKAYGVNSVIFGHTHSQFNKEVEGVNYFCNPIGYKSFEFQESFRERVENRIRVITI